MKHSKQSSQRRHEMQPKLKLKLKPILGAVAMRVFPTSVTIVDSFAC